MIQRALFPAAPPGGVFVYSFPRQPQARYIRSLWFPYTSTAVALNDVLVNFEISQQDSIVWQTTSTLVGSGVAGGIYGVSIGPLITPRAVQTSAASGVSELVIPENLIVLPGDDIILSFLEFNATDTAGPFLLTWEEAPGQTE
jgi:hypothetical protein